MSKAWKINTEDTEKRPEGTENLGGGETYAACRTCGARAFFVFFPGPYGPG